MEAQQNPINSIRAMGRRRRQPRERNKHSADEHQPHDPVNPVLVIYQDHPPYLYAAINKPTSIPDRIEWHSPFILSKRNQSGEEDVFGTVVRTLGRLAAQLQKLVAFSSKTAQRLHEAGVSTDEQSGELPATPLSDAIIDEQDDLFEEVLFLSSMYVRILAEQFPSKDDQFTVTVYDYDDLPVEQLSVSNIGNLMAHNRYIAIRDDRVADLMSDRRYLSGDPQTGLNIKFAEYASRVSEFLESFTVRDLVEKLDQMTRELSSSSEVRDIIFLVQNLYTLGGLVMAAPSPPSGPVKAILDRVAPRLYEQRKLQLGTAAASPIDIRAEFTTPRFYLDGDLLDKKIKTSMIVNGNREELLMGYEQFFEMIKQSAGETKLYGNSPLRA